MGSNHNAWNKKHIKSICLNLNDTTDTDIRQYLEDKNKNEVIKAALREYMRSVK